jgi:hypothetical protein
MNPCRLVTLAEAQTITRGAVVSSREAPLGPTCIYHAPAGKASARHSLSDITVAIASGNASGITRQMVKPAPILVGGHHAYCGKLGGQTLIVPLRSGQLLNVTAPCVIAERFAQAALKRLAA